MGEATDDGEREKEDHVFGHLPRHRHHLRGVVALRPHRQNGGRNQTRSAQTLTRTHKCIYVNAAVCVGCRPFVHNLPTVSKSFIDGVK